MTRATKNKAPAIGCQTQHIGGVASLTMEARDGVLFAQVKGLVTVTEEPEICRRLALALSDLDAVCLDYSRTVLAITHAGLEVLFNERSQVPTVRNMAWVMPDVETADRWRWQATRFAMAGLLRYETQRPDEAREWAIDQARRTVLRRAWYAQHHPGVQRERRFPDHHNGDAVH